MWTASSGSPFPRRLAGFLAIAPGERPIGVVLGSVSHRDPSIGHVDLIAVDPAERRRGVGRALLARIEGALAGHETAQIGWVGPMPFYSSTVGARVERVFFLYRKQL